MPSKSGHSGVPTPSDVAGFSAWHALLQAQVRLSAVLDRELQARTGLVLTTFEVLVTLLHAPDGRMRMQQVAGAVLLSKSGTTRVIGQLEHCGLVYRETPSDNRRTTYAVLSDEGRKCITAAMPVLFGLVDEHFARHLGPADTTTLLRILAKIPGPGHDRPPA